MVVREERLGRHQSMLVFAVMAGGILQASMRRMTLMCGSFHMRKKISGSSRRFQELLLF